MPITQTDIANRAMQRVGSELIGAGNLLTEDSKNAQQTRACYDILRRAEMRRNVWRFSIRTTALRPLGLSSKLLTFATYAAVTAYSVNDIVTGDDGQIYFSRVATNTGNTPSISPTKWTLYFGPAVATEFITTWGAGFTYAIRDHAVGSDGVTYYSLIDGNINHNPVGDVVNWAASVSPYNTATKDNFFAGEIVHIGGTSYLSLWNNNGQGTVGNVFQGGPPPSATWLTLTAQPTLSPFNFIYPIGSGPSVDPATKNIYHLPCGYLREAPQDPKAGQAQFLGAPDGSTFNDWNYEGDFFTTTNSGVITYRFAADVQDVNAFDPLFVEGFSCRLALELAEPLTQSGTKLQSISTQYQKFMTEARTVNGIEDGPIYPPEDSYITCRF
jgi:hypothetical protein